VLSGREGSSDSIPIVAFTDIAASEVTFSTRGTLVEAPLFALDNPRYLTDLAHELAHAHPPIHPFEDGLPHETSEALFWLQANYRALQDTLRHHPTPIPVPDATSLEEEVSELLPDVLATAVCGRWFAIGLLLAGLSRTVFAADDQDGPTDPIFRAWCLWSSCPPPSTSAGQALPGEDPQWLERLDRAFSALIHALRREIEHLAHNARSAQQRAHATYHHIRWELLEAPVTEGCKSLLHAIGAGNGGAGTSTPTPGWIAAHLTHALKASWGRFPLDEADGPARLIHPAIQPTEAPISNDAGGALDVLWQVWLGTAMVNLYTFERPDRFCLEGLFEIPLLLRLRAGTTDSSWHRLTLVDTHRQPSNRATPSPPIHPHFRVLLGQMDYLRLQPLPDFVRLDEIRPPLADLPPFDRPHYAHEQLIELDRSALPTSEGDDLPPCALAWVDLLPTKEDFGHAELTLFRQALGAPGMRTGRGWRWSRHTLLVPLDADGDPVALLSQRMGQLLEASQLTSGTTTVTQLVLPKDTTPSRDPDFLKPLFQGRDKPASTGVSFHTRLWLHRRADTTCDALQGWLRKVAQAAPAGVRLSWGPSFGHEDLSVTLFLAPARTGAAIPFYNALAGWILHLAEQADAFEHITTVRRTTHGL